LPALLLTLFPYRFCPLPSFRSILALSLAHLTSPLLHRSLFRAEHHQQQYRVHPPPAAVQETPAQEHPQQYRRHQPRSTSSSTGNGILPSRRSTRSRGTSSSTGDTSRGTSSSTGRKHEEGGIPRRHTLYSGTLCSGTGYTLVHTHSGIGHTLVHSGTGSTLVQVTLWYRVHSGTGSTRVHSGTLWYRAGDTLVQGRRHSGTGYT
jgi:hypothetical protein